ncbi:MAG: hypothetical protein GPJ54_14805, partial [Candidatus Heimdallarchaeota archaeon]|nr:hypothetical protein [Candidatus Heimdallarchaeota archaeon]
MRQLNYKDFSLIFAIALLIIVGSSNGNSVNTSTTFTHGIQNSEQSNMGQVSIESYTMNDRDTPFDSIQTSSFEPNWVERSPAPNPGARQHHAMAYDSINDKLILFGGNNGTSTDRFADTWAYDYKTNTWEEMKPSISPVSMYGHAMVYEPELQKVVMFGGYDGSSLLNDIWVYDYLTNVWEKQVPEVSPLPRRYHSMIYDTSRKKIVLIGGTTGAFETWEMDSSNYNWTNLSPITPQPALYAFAASYDQANDKIIIFGGQTSSVVNNGETYAYDYFSNEWTLLAPLDDPSDRRFYGRPMGYDLITQKSIFFGGYNGSLSNETWAFDYSATTWELSELSYTPSPRWLHTMVFNTQAGKFIMFGGSDGSRSGQTFELTPDSQPPQIINSGDKTIELGSVSLSISWQLTETRGGTYVIKLDNQIVDLGSFVDGQTISLVPFGMGIGNYNFEMIAT